jgi:hypothetical protein
VRVRRNIPSEPNHYGFVLGLGHELVLLQQFYDFHSEGYTVLRLADIAGVRSGPDERHWERMFAAEGILDSVGISYGVSLRDLPTLLRGLQQRGDNVIVECEDTKEPIEDFYIGKIISVAESLLFANFDALGRWDELPHAIAFDEITQVRFETPYVRTFSKYLEGPCPIVEGTS